MSRYSHDPTTHTLSLISGTNPDDYNFVGTTAEWEALTPAQKAQYESRDIIDDFNGDSIDSTPTYNSPHAVSSGGTYNAIKEVSDAIPTVDNVPTQGSTNPISSGAMFSALDDIEDAIEENKNPEYTMEYVNTGSSSAYIGFPRPHNATAGKIVVFAPLGTTTENVSWELVISQVNDIAYYNLDSTHLTTARSYSTIVKIQWTY